MQVFASKMVGMDCTSASVRTGTVSELILGMVLIDVGTVSERRQPRVPVQSHWQVGTSRTTCATGPRYSPDHILIDTMYILTDITSQRPALRPQINEGTASTTAEYLKSLS